jgi:hypothetical protein
MITIHKFQLSIDDHISVAMPEECHILKLDTQRGAPCLWALVDDADPKVVRHFAWRGTGHDCSGLKATQHIGTVQLSGGSLVFHLFEVKK